MFGSRRVKRTLGLGRKSAEKSADHAELFQTFQKSTSDLRSLIFRVQRAIWNGEHKAIVVFMPIRRYPGSPVVARYVFTLFRRCADRVYLRCYTQIRRSLCLRRYTDTSIAMNTPIRCFADRCLYAAVSVYLCERYPCIGDSVRAQQSVYRWMSVCARAPGVSVYRCTGARAVYRCKKRLANPNPQRCKLFISKFCCAQHVHHVALRALLQTLCRSRRVSVWAAVF